MGSSASDTSTTETATSGAVSSETSISETASSPKTSAPAEAAESVVYRFGDFELSSRPFRLVRRGVDGDEEEVPLQPQPARALELLARRSGELVTRDEMREHLWGEAHLEHEQAINFTVRRIRSALGDSAQQAGYVETLPRQGYRLVVPVERIVEPRELVVDEVDAAEPPERRRIPRRGWIAIVVALVLATALGVGWTRWSSSPSDLVARSTPLTDAQEDALWRARVLLRRVDAESVASAMETLEGLVVEAPDSAGVALAMGLAWQAKGALSPPPSGQGFDTFMPEMGRWGDRARTLDPTLIDAHHLVATTRFYHDLNARDAQAILEREVLARDPDHQNGLHLYGLVLSSLGRHDEGVEKIRRAVGLAPEAIYVTSDLALVLLLAGRYEESLVQARQNIELDPDDPGARWMVIDNLLLLGRDDEALAEMQRFFSELLDYDGIETAEQAFREVLGAAERSMEMGAPLGAVQARFALRLGRIDLAVEALQRACDGQGDYGLPHVPHDPRLGELWQDPRRQELGSCWDGFR